MKINNIFLAIILITTLTVSAKKVDSKDGEIKESDLKFYFINGYGVIYQKEISNNLFYRLHTEFDLKITNGDNDITNNNTMRYEIFDNYIQYYFYTKELKNKNFTVSFAPELGYNLINKNYVSLFVGGGPFFKYTYNFSDTYVNYYKDYYYDYDYSVTEQTTNAYSLGLIGFAGVESRINKNFKVFAEVELKAYGTWKDISIDKHSKGTENQLFNYKTDKTKKEWHYEFSRIKLGISILL